MDRDILYILLTNLPQGDRVTELILEIIIKVVPGGGEGVDESGVHTLRYHIRIRLVCMQVKYAQLSEYLCAMHWLCASV